MQGVRKQWSGLKIRMDKTKENGVIEKFIPGDKQNKIAHRFIIKFENGITKEDVLRQEFSVLRNQN
jgi:hypothetical protein